MTPKTFTIQLAVRSLSEGVHVQVKANSSEFDQSVRRDYGAAFNVKNQSLVAAVQAKAATLKSLAGTSRRYVPGIMAVNGDEGINITVKGESNAPKVKTSKVMASASKYDPCGGGSTDVSIFAADSQIRA